MMHGVFITGTDTGVGKTLISMALMSALREQGLRVQAMKPIASGCEQTPQGLRNDDAVQLWQLSDQRFAYDIVNPYAFAPAIAPHLAAQQAGIEIQLPVILGAYQQLTASAERIVVEGAGGWLVPLNDQHNIADLAAAMQLPVILVVGLRLGCINHAVLSYHSIIDNGCTCAGWIANQIDPDMQMVDENIATIRQRIEAPFLGVVPHQLEPNLATVSQHIHLPEILSK